MKCQKADRVSAYLEGVLDDQERREVATHLNECGGCAAQLAQLQTLRRGLKTLRRPKTPSGLHVSLRVIASRERSRRHARSNWRVFLATCAEDATLWINNLMRPLAIPFAGGLVSTVFLFSTLLPVLSTPEVGPHDVPTALTTEVLLKSTQSFGLCEDEIVVDLLVDEQGRMMDYSIPHGQPGMDPEMRRSVENTLLFTVFTPATMFGVPASGKTRITLRRSHMDVKG